MLHCNQYARVDAFLYTADPYHITNDEATKEYLPKNLKLICKPYACDSFSVFSFF